MFTFILITAPAIGTTLQQLWSMDQIVFCYNVKVNFLCDIYEINFVVFKIVTFSVTSSLQNSI